MKKLIFLVLIIFSCKKSDVTTCTLITIEQVTVLKEGHPEFYDQYDKTRVVRRDTLVCGLKGKDLQDLLDFLGRPENGVNFCIARNIATKSVKNTKK